MISRFFTKLTYKLPTPVTKNVNFLKQIRLQELEKEIVETEKRFARSQENLKGLSLFWQATHNRCAWGVSDKLERLSEEYVKLSGVIHKKIP